MGCGIMGMLFFSGCSEKPGTENGEAVLEQETDDKEREELEPTEKKESGEKRYSRNEEIEEPGTSEASGPGTAEPTEPGTSEASEPGTAETSEPETTEADWSEYFDGFQGAAVLYDPFARQFTVYNSELAETRRSPCSTFKIVSSLTALEHRVIEPGRSLRPWSGEMFWNENWNRDMEFEEAFRSSCVWYFREVIDEIGQEQMQQELDRLSYGNCDISDWEGRLNTNNNNPALTGFWIESSLKISPKEQTEVMERIFGEESVYSEETQNTLKEVMRIEEQQEPGLSIYGKTGMGKAQGIVVDAWFTGFAESAQEKVYFCVYLGRTDDKEVSSAAAREIAVRLASDYSFQIPNSERIEKVSPAAAEPLAEESF